MKITRFVVACVTLALAAANFVLALLALISGREE